MNYMIKYFIFISDISRVRSIQYILLDKYNNNSKNNNMFPKINQFTYHAELDLLNNTKQARNLQKNIQNQIKKVRTEESYQKSRAYTINPIRHKGQSRKDLKQNGHARRNSEYNKWYIQPELRYVQKQQNPKCNYKAYRNEQYLYRNLHNDSFWNWIHPFERQETMPSNICQQNIKNKVNLKILNDFKKKLDQQRIRLPMIVKQLLIKN